MKKVLFLSVFLVALVMAPSLFAQTGGWFIERFSADIMIEESGTVHVEETIQANFDTPHHGIFRDIPTTYTDETGAERYLLVERLAVMQDGRPAQVEETKQKEAVRFRIGDPEREITGRHEYVITYRVTGALQSVPSHDELYWNVTGNDWGVPINFTAAHILLLNGQILESACYSGPRGSQEPCDSVATTSPYAASFVEQDTLLPGEGLTVAVGFPKGTVPILEAEKPSIAKTIIIFLLIAFGFPLIVLTSVLWFWWKYGRDRGTSLFQKETIVAEYEPPENLRPAEVTTLLKERPDMRSVTATIVDLATRGLLTITEIKHVNRFAPDVTDYKVEKTDKEIVNLQEYEKLTLNFLFKEGNKMNFLHLKKRAPAKVERDISEIKKAILEGGKEKGYFVRHTGIARSFVVGIGIALTVYVLFIMLWSWVYQGVEEYLGAPTVWAISIALLLTFSVIILGVRIMPARTEKGRAAYVKAQGYKEFIEHTEKYRQPYFEERNVFMEVLPYAIAFGLTDKLAKAFENMGITPQQPGWYHGTGTFQPAAFASAMNTMTSSMSSTVSASSGGGSSGGGAGGGGGGGW